MQGKGTANKALLPILRVAFPELLAKRQTFALADDSLRMALAELAVLDIAHAPAHTLGEAFQALIGPRLRGERGQFFTPKSLVRAMVEVLDPQPNERVCDPACGTGGFLSETHIYQATKYPRRVLTGALVGIDKDEGLARLAGALMKVLTKDRAHIYSFNSLSAADWETNGADSPFAGFDVVLTNPPFGSKIGIKDKGILQQFDFGHIWTPNTNRRWGNSRCIAQSHLRIISTRLHEKLDPYELLFALNPPHRGENRRTAGVFLRNEAARYYIGHSGKIGGGRPGIGQDKFREFSHYLRWQEIGTPTGPREVVVFGPLEGGELLNVLAPFVHAVAEFKKSAVVSSSPPR